MAIFDSEKRPRGLRVPSLTAMKNSTASKSQFSFHRTKSEPRTPEESVPTLSTSAPTPVPVVPVPVPVPSSTLPAPAPPPTKDLPLPPGPPKKELPPRPSIISKVPSRKAVANPTQNRSEASPISQGIRPAASPVVSSPAKQEQPLPPTPSLGLRQAAPTTTSTTSLPISPKPQPEPEAASPVTIKASQSQGLRQQGPIIATPPSPQPQLLQQQQEQQPVQSLPPTPPTAPQPTRSQEQPQEQPSSHQFNHHPVQTLPPTPPPVTLSPPPPEEESDALTPLEDFIPTPDGASTPLEQMSSNEQTPGLTPDFEPVAAPLNKVHYACFQEHRNMPVAQNVWCQVPCMTCHKNDQEIRHRCVFCSLRVCEGCHRALQKTRNRSLKELMGSLN